MLCLATDIWANPLKQIKKFVGSRDAVLVADADGNILFSLNADQKRVPASTLKILTALMARHYLDTNFHFSTIFYMDKAGNLKIKGFGDPLLVSETVEKIALMVSEKVKKFNNLVIDDSYFGPVTIPGVSATNNPYDAPNGALCVNFNTVSFKRIKGGSYISGEPQTPFLPFILNRVKRSGMKRGRIVLSVYNNEVPLYAGHLFKYFLKKAGIQAFGDVHMGRVYPEKDQTILRYKSEASLDDILEKLLKYSNNFIANQLFISSGIQGFGPPGTLDKGRLAAKAYLQKVLGEGGILVDEGSGISRKNKISAREMLTALDAFEPFRDLMRHEGREYYKTGHLNGVRTRAGYIESQTGDLYRFVVLVNTPGKSTRAIMSRLLRTLN